MSCRAIVRSRTWEKLSMLAGASEMRRFICIFSLAAIVGLSCGTGVAQEVVRCAVVGGLNEIDFWPQIADRFQRTTGNRLEIVATGPKHAIADAFKAGEAEVIVMHSSDTLVNLVADGYGENLQPWARNDFLIVGPASD